MQIPTSHILAVHAELVFDDVKDVTLERVLEDLRKVIASDDAGKFSIAKMKEDYEAMIAHTSAAATASAGEPGVALTRKTAKELGSIKAEQALKAVKETMGAFNWYATSVALMCQELPQLYR